MMGLACRSMRSGLSMAGSSGRARPTERLRSRRPSSAIFSMRSIGETPDGHIGLAQRAECDMMTRLLDQMEMQLEDMEAAATEDELAAERAARSTVVKSFERRRPSRKPFPDHL